jgi:plasmid stabilization system protein ParE
MLRVNPEIGKAMPGSMPAILFVRVSEWFHRYLVFYRILSGDETLQIGRVLHGSCHVQRAIRRLYPNRS